MRGWPTAGQAAGRAARYGRGTLGVTVTLLALLLPASGSGASASNESAARGRVRNGRIAFAVDAARVGLGLNIGGTLDLDLFTVGPSGEGITQLTEGPTDDDWPQWSPDVRRVLFTRRSARLPGTDGGGGPQDIYVIDASGGEPTNLTNTPLDSETDGAWSPDGTRIVFASDRNQMLPRPLQGTELFLMDADGGNVVQLTQGADHYGPAWSPDGQEIAYVDNSSFIRLVRPDGVDLDPIPVGSSVPREPSWSPDGRRLAFHDEDVGDIWVVNRDGSGLLNLTLAHDGGTELSPAWSPDGKWIAFLNTLPAPRGTTLSKVRPDGSHIREIVDLQLPAEERIDWGPRR
ncbi:MAG: hypothetical protein ABR505_06185 [Actinomycetota bacterium]